MLTQSIEVLNLKLQSDFIVREPDGGAFSSHTCSDRREDHTVERLSKESKMHQLCRLRDYQ